MIAIIDYDAGNIKSVEKAVQFLGEEAIITRDRDVIMDSSGVILPGVGSFGDAMGKINEYGLKNVIYDVVDSGKPFLGICLGLQLLFKTSEETPGVTGLGIVDGQILRIQMRRDLRFHRSDGTHLISIRKQGYLKDFRNIHMYISFIRII